MRALVLALAVLCAILSGWTSAVAQAQDLGHGYAAAHAHGNAGQHSGSADCPSGCPHPAKASHPMLCSACFAVEVAAGDLGRLPAPVQRVRPAVELPLTAVAPKPAAPPPRPVLSS